MTTGEPRRALLRSVALRGFRSYERLDLTFGDGMVVLAGRNGVGKTNLLEACAFGCLGASPRTSAEFRCIREGSVAAHIELQVDIGANLHQRTVTIQAGSGKQLRLDGSPARSVDEFAASLPAVVFLPERLLVVRGAPARRRAALDRIVVRLRSSAAVTVREYARAVSQRNAVLRRGRGGSDIGRELEPWTDQVTQLGTELRHHRNAAVGALLPRFQTRLLELTGLDQGAIELELRGEELATALAAALPVDHRRGTTTAGPHLDDLHFLDGARDLRAFGSTGEQRAALLAWSLAEADVLTELTGTTPILLLDEPYAELDVDRRQLLSDALAGFPQVIVTTTEPPAHLLARREQGAALAIHAVSCGVVTEWMNSPVN